MLLSEVFLLYDRQSRLHGYAVVSNVIKQNEAHLYDEIMDYIWERVDKNVEAPCYKWVGPMTGSKETQKKHGTVPTPRAKKQIDGKRYGFLPHIVIYNYFNYKGKPSPLDWKTKGDEVRRECNNPLCMNINHLKLGKRNDTIAASIKRGTTAVGNTYGKKHDFDAIRAAHAMGKSYNEIMKEFDISSKGTVSYIINQAKS